MLTIRFHGVRGSTPSPCALNERYGGNTACVSLERPDADPIVFDLGTGLRNLGVHWPHDTPFRGAALVSHLHWDHIQGLPFFAPILREGSRLDIYGPATEGMDMATAFDRFMCRPYFPVTVADLAGTIVFHDVEPGTFTIGDAQVTVAEVPHVGLTLGYRVEVDGVRVAYVSDHQQPGVDDFTVATSVVELCRDADLLIHDAQYDSKGFAARSTWGHCTVDFAVEVALRSNARHLVLFHHDPAHDDRRLDLLLEQARRLVPHDAETEVSLAVEGRAISLHREPAVPRPRSGVS